MSYERFTERLRSLFRENLPRYIGTTDETMGDKIMSDGTPAGDLDNYMLKVLRAVISENFPSDYTIGEEDRKSEEQIQRFLSCQDCCQWTIDGLDGTGNRSLGTNSYGAMVSRRLGPDILFAAVFRPIDEALRKDGFYYAELDEGAWQWRGKHKQYHRLRTAQAGELNRVVVMLEGSSKKFYHPPLTELGKILTTRPGFSSCIAATTVARGKASALVAIDNKPWDNWPALLLIKEAGGIITDWQGNPCAPQNCGTIVAAANKADHELILSITRRAK